ncbi:MAG TPA: Hsp70 family protein [Chthoniobacteraceae bacterium]|jgi:molecular chaperone DnaK (HSP70)|nr:Hsp70 family protein [Chthoniobacteraceae bacterium]
MYDLGIDLGTTFSVLAVQGRVTLVAGWPAAIYLEDCDVTIIPSPEGEETFPSVVMEDPDEPGALLFGRTALGRADESGAPVLFSKRKMGTSEPIPMPSRNWTAKEIAREFLAYLKRCAEQALGETVRRAVVTHPAYFDRAAVEETRAAAREAGFDMGLGEQMLMEPVAAALTYTRTDPRDPLRILTYDLGGGTFDVTYLERSEGVIHMRAFDGDHLLGGFNFDRALVHWVRQKLEGEGRRIVLDEENPEDRVRLIRLLRIAEEVKIKLARAKSDTDKVEFRAQKILVDADGQSVQVLERLTRPEFVELLRPYLERTIERSKNALAKAGADVSAVDEIVLVGGSTYGPWVAQFLAAAFPGVQPKLFHPDLCVGAGAAIHAGSVLPTMVPREDVHLLLEVPRISVLELINVGGVVQGAAGRPLSLRLRLPTGELRGPEPADQEGRFLFPDIVLEPEGASEFQLAVLGGADVLLEHPFAVRYEPAHQDTSTVTTVLPRQLSILTFDGHVPLAAEGATLPARCVRVLRRENDNPSLTIKLFQERDHIGSVRIENIPAAAGRGSLVELEVEVTAENEIRGHAKIKADGRIVATTKVSIAFSTPEAKPLQELEKTYTDLGARVAQLDGAAPGHSALQRHLSHLAGLFAQQPVERMEIQGALNELGHLLDPPKDEMMPTRVEFCESLAECRKALAALAEAGEAVAGKKRMDPDRARRLGDGLAQIETAGLAAHARRDRRLWARAHEDVMRIQGELTEVPSLDGVPTEILKLMGCMHLQKIEGQLREQEARLAGQGRADDWRRDVDRIYRGLGALTGTIQKIDAGLPGDQGLAQVRLALRALRPLEEDIRRLGIDLGSTEPFG